MNKYARNIILNYFFEFIKYLNLMQTLWPMFLITRGFSLVEIGLLESIFHYVSLVMETPSGAFADVYGRKLSRILALIAHIIYFTLSIFTHKFWLASIAFVFAAIGYNFESGSGTALVYDSLKEIGKESTFTKVDTKREAIIRSASVVGLLVGGAIATTGYENAYLVTIGLTIVALIIALFMKETHVQEKKVRLPFFKAIAKQYTDSIAVLKKDKILAEAMIYFALIGSIIASSWFYMTTYWQANGFSTSIIGGLFALASLSGALAALFANKLLSHLSPLKVFMGSFFLLVIALGLLVWLPTSIGGLIIIVVIDSLVFVSMNTFFNKRIESQQRATVLSFSSMMYSVAMIALFPLLGWLIQATNYPVAYLILSGVTLIFLIGFFFFVFQPSLRLKPVTNNK